MSESQKLEEISIGTVRLLSTERSRKKGKPDRVFGGIIADLNRAEDVYFAISDVLEEDRDRLKEGALVQFVREVGETGPQAHQIAVLTGGSGGEEPEGRSAE